MDGDARITQLLQDWAGGDRGALDSIVPSVFDELKRTAAAYLAREPHARILQPTALVNEAYLRLVNVRPGHWECRAQFFALAAKIMRHILVDHARAQLGPHRGGRAPHLPLDSPQAAALTASASVLGLDEALVRLGKENERHSRLAELRLFTGATNEEAAEALHISSRTVIRDWNYVRAWLIRELGLPVPD